MRYAVYLYFLVLGFLLCYSISIYPIVSYAPAFLHSFLLLVTVVKSIGQKRHYISTPWYWNFSCVLLYLSNSTIRTSLVIKHRYLPILCKEHVEVSQEMKLINVNIVLILFAIFVFRVHCICLLV